MFGTFLVCQCHVALVGVPVLRPVDKQSTLLHLHFPVHGWKQRRASFKLRSCPLRRGLTDMHKSHRTMFGRPHRVPLLFTRTQTHTTNVCCALPYPVETRQQMSARTLNTRLPNIDVTPGRPFKKLSRGVTKTTTVAASVIGLFTIQSRARDKIAAV